ncbi:permease-like cell division protein FtsX [Anaerotalea alkaliphila]|uniref:Cell division protein FtsX n=1 Tax=Anaerotalea alkaliphila TaxID=2662126 RepID=A0A7X5KNC5_9FIRM|nr:permease-like cell division protein FtsX [Anaerotalea alkaliphila]NDL67653.1 ABC transporter permease [Anaerotalea alkaliphila]
MKIRTLGYCMHQGVRSMFKNRLMSVASISTISACLLVVGIFFAVAVNVEHMLGEIENRIGLAVFFNQEVEEEKILEIKTALEAKPEVHKVEYVSAAQAWENFKEEYFRGREDLLVGFDDDNPLEDSASLQIFMNDISMQKQLVGSIGALPEVRYVRQAEQVTSVIESFNSLVAYTSLGMTAILVMVSIFLISNTVRLAISIRKKEIKIMRYVGAKNSLITAPFLFEGILIGVVGSLIPMLLIYLAYDQATERLHAQFLILREYLVFLPVWTVLQTLVPLSLFIGVLIGLVGSQWTIHKYLKA